MIAPNIGTDNYIGSQYRDKSKIWSPFWLHYIIKNHVLKYLSFCNWSKLLRNYKISARHWFRLLSQIKNVFLTNQQLLEIGNALDCPSIGTFISHARPIECRWKRDHGWDTFVFAYCRCNRTFPHQRCCWRCRCGRTTRDRALAKLDGVRSSLTHKREELFSRGSPRAYACDAGLAAGTPTDARRRQDIVHYRMRLAHYFILFLFFFFARSLERGYSRCLNVIAARPVGGREMICGSEERTSERKITAGQERYAER